VDIENLVEPESSEEVPAALAAMDDVEMSVTQFLQAQRDPGHCPHEGGIHHGTILQVHHELAVASVDHFAGKFLQIAAVKEAAFALDLHPNGISVYPNLD
jgi:hypothetical protein